MLVWPPSLATACVGQRYLAPFTDVSTLVSWRTTFNVPLSDHSFAKPILASGCKAACVLEVLAELHHTSGGRNGKVLEDRLYWGPGGGILVCATGSFHPPISRRRQSASKSSGHSSGVPKFRPDAHRPGVETASGRPGGCLPCPDSGRSHQSRGCHQSGAVGQIPVASIGRH